MDAMKNNSKSGAFSTIRSIHELGDLFKLFEYHKSEGNSFLKNKYLS